MSRGVLRIVAVTVVSLFCLGQAFAAGHAPPMSPEQALGQLKDGNARFAAGKSVHPNLGADRRAETARGGQHPFAAVVGCSDSRCPIEHVFDQGAGDIFIVRVAGNVCGTDETGSVEYGVDHVGTPLLVVLGHTQCGAVTAAVSGGDVHGRTAALIDAIKPAVAEARKSHPEATGEDLLPLAVEANVWLGLEHMLKTSAIVREAVKAKKLIAVGAIYDIATGEVRWLGPLPRESEILAAPAASYAGVGPGTTNEGSGLIPAGPVLVGGIVLTGGFIVWKSRSGRKAA